MSVLSRNKTFLAKRMLEAVACSQLLDGARAVSCTS
jgi:hypothetical protein